LSGTIQILIFLEHDEIFGVEITIEQQLPDKPDPGNRRCLTTYLGSSVTQAMCASWQASTIADMPDMVI
jgi:hypothetical protein